MDTKDHKHSRPMNDGSASLKEAENKQKNRPASEKPEEQYDHSQGWEDTDELDKDTPGQFSNKKDVAQKAGPSGGKVGN